MPGCPQTWYADLLERFLQNLRAAGTSVSINGTNFAPSQGTSTLKFNRTTTTPALRKRPGAAAPIAAMDALWRNLRRIIFFCFTGWLYRA